MYRDNQSTMRLAENEKASSGKRTRHINIRYFFITDRIAKKEVAIQYCPTKQMVADYFTKALQGALFYKFRDQILGVVPMDTINGDQRSVLDADGISKGNTVSLSKRKLSGTSAEGQTKDVHIHKRRSMANVCQPSWADVVKGGRRQERARQ
jgi:hypothetical protein